MTKIKKIVKQVTKNPFIDRVLGKTMSKKLTVFFVGTIFMFLGKLNGEQWIDLATLYIGTQATIDGIVALRSSRKIKTNQETIIENGETGENYQ